ncbi:hypothetical protein [Azohydromonas caseinilytica]|uniref:Uncharacterized protein n=1 Tax=Azohydromonas caseinilytica TaxID=2728836 RepID=A0A848F6X2_9BURK|nr:hypothetical protein [Azohydromonas caseinilytica]NML15857.1 hypothetical protein [Azohydromonas caseinilytica]
MDTPALPLTRFHLRRLHELWRSAGWPCQDLLEVELLAAGLLERLVEDGRERLRLTETGIAALAAGRQRNRRAFDAHEALVERVARHLQRSGRVVYTELKLRAQVAVSSPTQAVAVAEGAPAALPSLPSTEPLPPGLGFEDEMPLPSAAPGKLRWVQARPDVFSIRYTSVEAYLQPLVHEIKVRRSDLLSDLRKPEKRAAYLGMAAECWYVLAEGIGGPEDVPPECGVLIATASGLECARPAPPRAKRMRFDLWMALARATPLGREDDERQGWLGGVPDAEDCA